MGDAWKRASLCPHCGGRLVLSVFYSFSRDYLINLDGRPRKRHWKSSEGEMDICSVWCNKCGTLWDGNNSVWDKDGAWIRGNGLRP